MEIFYPLGYSLPPQEFTAVFRLNSCSLVLGLIKLLTYLDDLSITVEDFYF